MLPYSKVVEIPSQKRTWYVNADAIDYVTGGERGTFNLVLRGGSVLPITEATISLPHFLVRWKDALDGRLNDDA